jgi:DNA-binding response OmpR family regulator
VDDDEIVLHLLTAALGESGIDCVWAQDGRAGLRRLSEEILSLDLLVTDLVMPDLPGDALVLAVRELGGERELPIVVVSSHLDPARAKALRAAGADAVVDKSHGLASVAAVARDLLIARGRMRPSGSPEEVPAAHAIAEPAPAGRSIGRIALERQRG